MNNRYWIILVVIGLLLVGFTYVTEAWEGEFISRPYADVSIKWSRYSAGSPPSHNYQCVDDVTPDNDFEYIYARSGKTLDTYGMTNVPVSGGCATPQGIAIYFRIRHTGSPMDPGQVKVCFSIAGTNYWSDVALCPIVYATREFIPHLSGEYSYEDWVDATITIEATYVARRTEVRCTQLYSIITYTIPDPTLTHEYPSDGCNVYTSLVNTSVLCSYCKESGSYENTVEFLTNLSGDWETYGWYNYSGTSSSFTAYNDSINVTAEGQYWWRVNFTEGVNHLSVVETYSFYYSLFVPPSSDRLPIGSGLCFGLFGVPFWLFWKRRREDRNEPK